MLTHVVTLTLTPESPPGQAQRIVTALEGLPAVIPEIKEYRVGTDLGLAEGNHTLALVATFDDEAGFLAYFNAPAHRQVVAELIRPVTAQRSAVQFHS